MEIASVQEAFRRINSGESLAVLYVKYESTLKTTMLQACERVAETQSIIPMVCVEVDPETLISVEAKLMGLVKVPQLRFYHKKCLIGTMVGRTSPSELHAKIVQLYASH